MIIAKIFALVLCTIHSVTCLNGPVFITGGTSEIGKKVVHHLASEKIKTRCLIRNVCDVDKFENNEYIELVHGNILNKDSLNHIMSGCSASINLHGTIRHSTPWKSHHKSKNHPYYVNYIGMKNIIECCVENNINRLIRLTGLATAYPSYHPIPLIFDALYSRNIHWHKKAEELIEDSNLVYTILRPGGIRNDNFSSIELQPNSIKPPAFVDTNNLAKIVVASLLPDVSSVKSNISFENAYIAIRGIKV